jgi:DNA ligase-1
MAVAIKQAQAGTGPAVTVGTTVVGPRLTKTGKISTAVGGAVVKDTAPPCLLAHKWEGEDPTGYWMSEKLDGVRAWWDGTQFISRLGNTYHAPEWFRALLPNVFLDGELWVGRKQFQKTISAVRKLVPTDSEWLDVIYVMFDAPKVPGSFEDRQKYLTSLFPILRIQGGEGVGQVVVAEQIKCTGVEHLRTLLRTVEALGAEGLMLREAGSLYEDGRSKTCLKVKTFFDAEAVVVGYTDGRGKHKGRVGALEVDWNGVKFEVGTGLSDAERKAPPAIGSLITFRYQELTDGGTPRFPSFLAIRNYE